MTHTHDKLYKTLTEAWKQLQENTVDISKVWVIRNNANGKWIGKDGKWCDVNPSMNPLDYIKGYTRQGAVRIINKPISPTGDKYHDLTAMVLDSAIKKYLTANSSNSVVAEESESPDLSPGTVVVASGYPRNSMSMKPEATAIPKFIGVISDTHEGQNISAYPIKMLSSGGLPDVQGRYLINKGLPVEVADISALGLSPEEIQKANEIIAKFTGKVSQNMETDPNLGGRLGT